MGREKDLEPLNRRALQIAKEVADEHNGLMAGNICNTTIYDPKNQHTWDQVREIFKEQIEWAASEGADFIVGETFGCLGETELALECIQKYGHGLPAVVTLSQTATGETVDGIPYAEACRILESKGAAVVGLNCGSGPKRHIELMKKIRAACKVIN